MANDTFTQKITLEGGDVINKQLKDLGEIGQQAFQKVQASAGPASKMLDQLQSTVSGLFGSFRELAKSFDAGFGKVVSDLGEATVAATKFGAGFGGIIAAASAVSAAVGHMGQAASDSIAKVNDLAEKAGLTLEKYQELKAAGEGIGLGGTDFAKAAETAKDTIEKLQLALGKGVRVDVSAEDQKTAPLSDLEKKYDVLNKLGVAIRDVDGALLGSGDIVDAFVAALAKIDVAGDDIASTAKRTAIATQFFGKAVGDAMVSASESLGKVNENMGAVSASGVKFSASQKETIDQARRTGVALGAVVSQWKDYVLALAAPVTVDQNNAVLKLFADNKGAIKGFLDDFIGPALRWLGELKNTLGAASIAAAALGLSFGAIGPVTAAALGIAGGAFIFFWDDVKKNALDGMAELKRIMSTNDFSTWEGWKNAASQIWDDISSVAERAFEKIKTAAFKTFPGLEAQWESFKSVAVFVWDIVKTGAIMVWDAILKIKEIANESATVINAMFGTNFTGATLLATLLFAKLASSMVEIPGWLRIITAAFMPVVAAFTVFTPIARGVGAALDYINGKASGAGAALHDYLGNWFSSAFPGLAASFGRLKDSASTSMTATGLVVRAGFDYIKALFFGSKDTQAQAWDILKDATTLAWNRIKQTISGAWEEVKKTFGIADILAELHRFDTAVERISDSLKKIAHGDIWGALKGGDAEAPDGKSAPAVRSLPAPSTGDVGGVTQPFGPSLWSALSVAVQAIMGGFTGAPSSNSPSGSSAKPSAADYLGVHRSWVPGRRSEASPADSSQGEGGRIIQSAMRDDREGEALNLSGSLRSTTTAFDGLIGKIGQFAAALVAPGNGSGLQMPGLGGLAMPAMAMAPAFAAGGSSGASGGRPNAGLIAFTLGINGSQEQVYATREVIDDLRRLAAAAQMSSTTKRSPSWDT